MSNVATMPQQQQQPAAPSPVKFTITAEIDGFAVTIEGEGRADQLRGVIDRLKQIGASPVSNAAAAASPSPSPAQQSGPPLCPVHGKPMKPSRKPGTFYCTSRNADGSYCQASA